MALLFFVYFYVTHEDDAPAAEPEPIRKTPAYSQPAPPPKPSPLDQILKQRAVNDAIRVARPFFSDTKDDLSPGAAILAIWGSRHMLWTDLNSLPETKWAMVMKDPEAERGKRICGRGSIVEISTDRTTGEPIYYGGLMLPGYHVLRFAAVGSTGELVQDSPARFCGVAIGTQSYSNSAGGMSHAVYAVGMFDLVENRATDTQKATL